MHIAEHVHQCRFWRVESLHVLETSEWNGPTNETVLHLRTNGDERVALTATTFLPPVKSPERRTSKSCIRSPVCMFTPLRTNGPGYYHVTRRVAVMAQAHLCMHNHDCTCTCICTHLRIISTKRRVQNDAYLSSVDVGTCCSSHTACMRAFFASSDVRRYFRELIFFACALCTLSTCIQASPGLINLSSSQTCAKCLCTQRLCLWVLARLRQNARVLHVVENVISHTLTHRHTSLDPCVLCNALCLTMCSCI
jgi:hypothetical protein